MRPILLAAILTLAALASACTPLAHAASAPASEPRRRALTVTGTATLDVVPDCLDVSMSLVTKADRPKKAMAELRVRQEVLVKALLGAGVAPADIKISGMTVNETHEPSTGRVNGYEASLGVVASTKKLELVGDVMEAASGAGTQNMTTSYRVTDLLTYKKKVRQMALLAAKEKASDTAAALSTKLGHVADVSESAGEWNPGAFGNAYVANPSGSAQMGPMLQPLTLSVNVVYELD
jgi:uncharacterized protein YggE